MALAAAIVWEVRTAGNVNNGGGFKEGATGTDFSQQDAAQVTYTDLVIGNPTTTQLTSAANPFTSAHVGNIINITGGTGFTTGRYEIISVASSIATVDRSVGTAGSTGGTGNLGGAVESPGTIGSALVAGNTMWIKSGTYTMSTSNNVSGGRLTVSVTGTDADPNEIFGYQTTRGDNGTRPIFAANAASVTLLTNSGAHTRVHNIEFSRNGQTGTRGITHSGGNGYITSCYFNDLGNGGANVTGAGTNIQDCGFNACNTNPALTISSGSAIHATNCVIVNGSGVGIDFALTTGSGASRCLIHNLSNEGIQTATNAAGLVFHNCTIEGITGSNDGYLIQGTAKLYNCIAYNCGAFGFNGAGKPKTNFLFNCAGGNNSSGNFDSSDFTTEGFITLTADPFTSVGGDNFELNNTAGGGALLRGEGYPSAFFTTLTATDNFLDVGVAQHEDAGGGGGTVMVTYTKKVR